MRHTRLHLGGFGQDQALNAMPRTLEGQTGFWRVGESNIEQLGDAARWRRLPRAVMTSLVLHMAFVGAAIFLSRGESSKPEEVAKDPPAVRVFSVPQSVFLNTPPGVRLKPQARRPPTVTEPLRARPTLAAALERPPVPEIVATPPLVPAGDAVGTAAFELSTAAAEAPSVPELRVGVFDFPSSDRAPEATGRTRVDAVPAGFDDQAPPSVRHSPRVSMVVTDAGFGDGGATGQAEPRRGQLPRATTESGFGVPITLPAASSSPRRPEQNDALQVLSLPAVEYTEEASRLKVEGDVVLEAAFMASGNVVRVLRVVRGLGHGLDEAAIRAAEEIRYKPKYRDGQPVDHRTLIHIVFRLA